MVKKWLSPDAGVLLAVLVLFAGLSYQMAQQAKPGKNKEGDHPRRTVHSARPGGWKAWYLLLKERGITLQQNERGPASWEKSNADVVICGPVWEGDSLSTEAIQNQWSAADAKSALAWVENGGTLLMATDTNNKVTSGVGLDLEEDPSDKTSRQNQPGVFTQPAAFFNGLESLSPPGKPYLSRTAKEAVVLMERGDKTVMVARKRGKGIVLVLTSPGLFDNVHLKDNNARFAAQIVEAWGTTDDDGKTVLPTVLFDEYHQGYRDTDGFWEAVGRPGQLVALQILALALLTVYGAGKRFGLPMPLPAASRVSSEYVTSLADLYRRARAYDAVLEGVYQSFWRDLCKTVGVAGDTPTAEVVRRASAALAPVGTKADDVQARLTALTRECEDKIAGGPQALNEADLLRLARALSEMRKELQLGGAYSV